MNDQKVKYRRKEPEILEEIRKHIENTYTQHYQNNDDEIDCIDAWISLGAANTTLRDNALKYLWRYGRKGLEEEQRKDLLKAIHIIMSLLYVDHYKRNDTVPYAMSNMGDDLILGMENAVAHLRGEKFMTFTDEIKD